MPDFAPKISVVIPAYNAADTIPRTLDSVITQTYLPHEIIVVDDGSKDQTREVVAAYAPQVKLIARENGGPAAARNLGIQHATGDWIAFLDSDDAWLPNKLERQVPYLTGEFGIVHCFFTTGPDKFDYEVTFDRLWEHNCLGTSSIIADKTILDSVGGFEEDRRMIGSEDYNLWLRILHQGHKVKTVREELVIYTPIENSLSQRYASVIESELFNIAVLSDKLSMDSEPVHTKQIALYEEYARALFWKRNMPLARRYYGRLLTRRPSASSIIHWLATFIPPQILDYKRETLQNA